MPAREVVSGDCLAAFLPAEGARRMSELLVRYPVTKVGGFHGRQKKQVIMRITTAEDVLDLFGALWQIILPMREKIEEHLEKKNEENQKSDQGAPIRRRTRSRSGG
ncbi:MAG: hypothetical protein JSW58_08685 [Candidatus Latescibacterota bacterium]|nr:MAG: hypothetical protein JSW58_08685 [Candidatus Latescibacterota bacterium]